MLTQSRLSISPHFRNSDLIKGMNNRNEPFGELDHTRVRGYHRLHDENPLGAEERDEIREDIEGVRDTEG